MRADKTPVSRILFLLITVFLLTIFSTSLVQAWSWFDWGWTDFEDKNAGIQLKHPKDWRVEIDQKTLRTRLHGPDGQLVVIWPVFIKNIQAAERGLDRASAEAVLTKLLPEVALFVHGIELLDSRSNLVRVSARRDLTPLIGALSWRNFPDGTAAYLYAFNAFTHDDLRKTAETAAKIFESFEARGPKEVSGSKAAASPSIRYVRWHDPTEGAFSIEVPEGWTTKGGISRPAAVDVRVAWVTISPEGDIRITGGDTSLPTFTVLNPTMQMGGSREGSWYSPGYGVQTMIRRYQTGRQFLIGYIRERMAQSCATPVEFTRAEDLPQLSQQISALLQRHGLPSIQNYGLVTFHCTQKNGKQLEGYYVASTQLNTAFGVQQWKVETLLGYLAVAEKAPLAHQIYSHVVQSGKTNPDWHRRQGQFIEGITKIVSSTNAAISNTIREARIAKEPIMNEIDRRRANAIRGLEDVVYTATGQKYKVESGNNFYWINNRGEYVGTDTHTLPDIDFRELTRQP